MKRGVLFAAMFVIAGCAAMSPPPLAPGHAFTGKPGVGHVFGSVTQTFVRKQRSALFDDSYVSSICVDCDVKGGLRAHRASVTGGKNNDVHAEFPGENGAVFVFELPVGEHQLDHWYAREAYTTVVPEKNLPPLKFQVREGEVLYLGNVHMALTFGNNALGAPVTTGVKPEIRHAFDRDLRVALAAHPGMPRDRLRNEPLPAGAWPP